ncbi:hypothetical protein F5883DRAFT_644937 [Diaporthe sp. PMI_573]|nr:hypothetical protein F5883DRAFT_644937 [Diaporthaceae sp. PMI_573]
MTVFFDSSSKTAFFKLQSPVILLVPSSQTDHFDTVRSNVHLCIRPEHIISLVHDRPELPESLAPLDKKIEGQETIRLKLKLSKPPEWIVPSFETLMPKTHEDSHLRGAGFIWGKSRSYGQSPRSRDTKAEKKEALLKERIAEADQRQVQLAEATAEVEELQLEQLKQYVDDRLERTRVEIRELIDEHFDELSVDVVLTSEMEEYVDEAIRAAEDDLREMLSGIGVRMIFNDSMRNDIRLDASCTRSILAQSRVVGDADECLRARWLVFPPVPKRAYQ